VIHDGKAPYPLYDLIPPASGWTTNGAVDINDRGQIVGEGTNPQGYLDGFLLDPLPDTSPALWLLAGIALTGLGRIAGSGTTNRRADHRDEGAQGPVAHVTA
jgi:hypothetical protein